MPTATPSTSEATPPKKPVHLAFDGHDFGWIIMSIGMAIGAGIVFLPVQVGLVGLWAFLTSAMVGYPAMFLFQRLFVNSLSASEPCTDYPGVISNYLGRNAGVLLGLIYFLMLVLWICVYSTAITNDTASYLQTFGVTRNRLSDHSWYPLALISLLVLVASRGENTLFRIATFLVLSKLAIVAYLGFAMAGLWNVENIGPVPEPGTLAGSAVATLPFTLTSILFLQTLSPMVCSYRAREVSPENARRKAQRSMSIAFGILFTTVFFFAVSFALALGHSQAEEAFHNNVSALAIAARFLPPGTAVWLGVVLNIFAVVTAFFGAYLGFHEAVRGIALNLLRRFLPEDRIPHAWLDRGIQAFIIVLAFAIVQLDIPVLYFTSVSGPAFAVVGCFIPVWLVLKVPVLAPYKNPFVLGFVALTGLLLTISPLFEFS